MKKYGVILFLGLFFTFVTLGYIYYSYTEMMGEEMSVTKSEAETLDEFLRGYREYYQKLFASKKMPLNAQTLHALPAFALNELSDRFSEKNSLAIALQTVSDVARNPKNEARAYQREMIEFFRKNPSINSDFRIVKSEGEHFYHYSSALRVSEMCLVCHGKKESAPSFIAEKYQNAYDYKEGDVRGITSIKIPFGEVRRRYLPSFYVDVIYGASVMLLLFAVCSYFLIKLRRHNLKLEDMVAERTMEFKMVNERLKELVDTEIEKVRQRDTIIHEQSRQSAVTELLINMAHHWRQPLNVITLSVSNIEDIYEYEGGDREKIFTALKKINSVAAEVSALISGFTEFYENKRHEDFIIGDPIKQASLLLKDRLEKTGIEIHIPSDCTTIIRGDEKVMMEVFVALIQNVIDVATARGLESSKIEISCIETKEAVDIEIADNCGGIDKEMLPKLFEPYTTTHFKSKNRGLGLYVVSNLIKRLFFGKISAKNTQNGAIFTIQILKEQKNVV